MSIRGVLLFFAILLSLAGLGAGGLYFYRDRLELRVASGPENGELWKFLGAAHQVLGEGPSRLRFRRVATPSEDANAKALESGAADLAVLRSDMPQPANSATLAILRRDFIFLIVPGKSQIDEFKDLQGKAVGILPGPMQDVAALEKIMSYYAMPERAITRVPVTAAEAGNAIRAKRIAAVFVVGQPLVGPASEAFAAIARSTKTTPDIVGIDGSEAIARTWPMFDTAEIAQGAFGGAKPQPEEATTTLAVTHRLVSRRSLPDIAAGVIARKLMEGKGRLVAVIPVAAQIEAPETKKDQSFLIHPGAVAYYDGEETSLFDRFESLFWLGGAFLSLFASLGAWFWRKLHLKKDEDWGEVADRLFAMVGEARTADAAALDRLEAEYDEQFAEVVRARAAGFMENEDAPLISATFDHLRRALEARRDVLAAGGDEGGAGRAAATVIAIRPRLQADTSSV